MAPQFACSMCSHAMVVYDPAAAQQRRAGKRERRASAWSTRTGKRARQEKEASAKTSSGACAGAIDPHDAVAPPVVLDVKPLNAVQPRRRSPAARKLPPPSAAREVPPPPCLRKHFLSALGLRLDLTVHFIAEKVVRNTDVDAHQSRFRIPDGGVKCLRTILTAEELDVANLLHVPAPRARHKPKKPADDAAAEAGKEEGKKIKEPKKKGKVHGGLRVKLVDLAAGASKELQMSRWDSSRATVVKGEGYLDFIRRCSFREDDTVEMWAFMQRPVRIFGVNMQHGDAVLHVLIVKKHQPQQCCYCPIPHAH